MAERAAGPRRALHETRAGDHEHALLVGLALPRADPAWTVEDSLDELARLAETAGARVAGRVVQGRRRPDPATFVGRGKVDEIGAALHDQGADFVVFDDELAPAQQRNLERALGVKVVDRTGLVLDIFARRAQTHEGRLQVELAQLTYLLPRLAGRGAMLSRLGGGIGTRGPGETKLEVDRRRIRRRITDLRREIGAIGRHRRVQRSSRRGAGLPIVALVGYTNAGKSTLLNALTGAGAFVENLLFATLDPMTRRVSLPNGRAVLVVDTVGFIQKLPTELVAAFRATLEEVTEADVLVHVVDASHPRWREQMAAVAQVLRSLGAAGVPTLVALNKIDRLDPAAARWLASEVPGSVAISAQRDVGLLNLLRTIGKMLPGGTTRLALDIPYERSGLLSELYERGRVLAREYRDDLIHVEAEVDRAEAARIRAALDDGAGR